MMSWLKAKKRLVAEGWSKERFKTSILLSLKFHQEKCPLSSTFLPMKIIFSSSPWYLIIIMDLESNLAFKFNPFALFCHEAKVSRNDVNHISAYGKIHYVDDVPNILAFLGGYVATKNSKLLSVEHRVEDICKFVETQDDLVSQGSFIFSAEQLKLSFKSPNQRRYSPTLLAAALLWQNTSPALYKLLSTVNQSVCLPSVRHLQRFGHLYGYDEEQGTSKTVLWFMLTGVASSYRDIVCMVPPSKINHEIIGQWWWKVVEAVAAIGFRIVASISDGHSANRKFFTDGLNCGENSSFVKNPFAEAPNVKVFPFFDKIHIIKGLYTNLLNKGEFECPAFQDRCVNPKTSHFCELYKSELGAPNRYAPKLSHKVLFPLPIERTNVNLAVKFFHESTEAALKQFSLAKGQLEWAMSSAFVNIVRRFFNCINVKSSHFESRKRDGSRKAVYRDDQK